MGKNVLILSASPRKNGNSETLADAFIRGAEEAGNTAEKICLYDKNIGFCKGCLSCQKQDAAQSKTTQTPLLEK